MTSEAGLIRVFTQFPEIKAGFTTRHGGVSSPPFAERNLGFFAGDTEPQVAENWKRTLKEFGLGHRSLALPRMVHGTLAQEVTASTPDGMEIPVDQRAGLALWAPRDCDAVHSQDDAWVMAVTMADCTPILVYDPTTRRRAAIHAGWRGTRDGIVAKTLASLFQGGLAKPATTWVCLGPAISGKRLELGPEVMASVDARFAVSWNEGGKVKQGMDMLAWNRQQALETGIPSHQVECLERCTYDEPEFFFSYRRDGPQSGRMAALIGVA